MSTRCNIVIEFGDTVLYVYRHHDGYLSGTGRDLVNLLKKEGKTPWKFISSLLGQRYEKQSYESEAHPVYETTNSIHGDIEYLYRIKFPGINTILVGYTECPYTSDNHHVPYVNDVKIGDISDFEFAIEREEKNGS